MENKPDIINIIAQEGIELKRGKALCPFHAENTPSFMVNRDRHTFHCFGCGERGDVIYFIMKLKGISFKDALVYLGIKNGRPVKANPAIALERKIQKDYETAIANLYEKLCQQSRELHKVRVQVKKNPGALTEQGAVYFAESMGRLAVIDFKIETILQGSFEDKIFLLRGDKNAACRDFKQTAIA